jgi:hypothetical protein
LEFSAREKGVQFILNRHMDEIIREQQFSGRVLGIRASYSPRLDPQTGARLESLWQNGNIDDRSETIFIRARKAVIIGAGGHGANPQFRSMFYPAWREPAFVSSGWALLGPRGQDASGIIAGMRVGANLAGMQQNLSYANTFHIPGILATRDSYTDMFPGHPTFSLRGSTGINLPNDSFQHLIVVNQVGKRFLRSCFPRRCARSSLGPIQTTASRQSGGHSIWCRPASSRTGLSGAGMPSRVPVQFPSSTGVNRLFQPSG